MAFFKDTVAGPRDGIAPQHNPMAREPEKPVGGEVLRRTIEPAEARQQAPARAEPKESLIAADLTIEGKIEGAGNVRIAGRFKGDVQVQGNLTIESGAQLTGQVKAKQVIIGGELHGNIDGAQRVEILETGALVGDVKAGSLTVAAGSRMRGQVEFGWADKAAPRAESSRGNGPAA